MLLFKRVHKHGAGINIASLIDVFFLLIIFFMLISQVTPVETDLELPEAETGRLGAETESKRVVFNVRGDGGLLMLGETVSMEDAHSLLSAEVSARGPENVEVLIRGDRSVDWRHVARVLDICTTNGIMRVRVAVAQRQLSADGS